MKTPDQKLNDIVTALNAYSPIQAPEIVKSTLEGLDEASIGVLHGITGVFCHAVSVKMPRKWIALIHEDLLDAFCALSEIAHQDRLTPAEKLAGATLAEQHGADMQFTLKIHWTDGKVELIPVRNMAEAEQIVRTAKKPLALPAVLTNDIGVVIARVRTD